MFLQVRVLWCGHVIWQPETSRSINREAGREEPIFLHMMACDVLQSHTCRAPNSAHQNDGVDGKFIPLQNRCSKIKCSELIFTLATFPRSLPDLCTQVVWICAQPKLQVEQYASHCLWHCSAASRYAAESFLLNYFWSGVRQRKNLGSGRGQAVGKE